MRGNRTVALACVFLSAMLAGCGTAGNQVLVFGTDTKVALDVSGDPTGQPSFTLGYKRREAVWLPLAAGHSLSHRCMGGSGGKLNCTATDQSILATHVCVEPPKGTESNATAAGEPMFCLSPGTLMAKFVGKKNAQEDAYSVMASFGLDSSDGNAKIAQYLATGFAARALAESGGAALVSPQSVSPAAARIREIEQSDIDLIVKHVAASNGIDQGKFDQLVDKTRMSVSRKNELKAETVGKTPDQVRVILGQTRYSPFLGDLRDAMSSN